MDFSGFFRILKRHKLTLILVPAISVIITYFLVRNQPNIYASQVKIATGITDQTQTVLSIVADAQESKINQQFSNLIEMVKSKKILEQLSYKLMIHDLTSSEPYTKPSSLFKQLNASAREHAVATYTDLYNSRKSLNLFNPDQNGMNQLLESMHYDQNSLLKNITVYRIQSSDYLYVEYDAETPYLSSYAANTLCNEFIEYYTLQFKQNQKRALDFWTALLSSKQDTLNRLTDSLKAYKIRHNVINPTEEARNLYLQISEYETRREEAQKEVQSTRAAINDIDNQFDPRDRQYLESSMVNTNERIVNSENQLKELNDQYVKSDFDPKYEHQMDSLNSYIQSRIHQLSDKYILNPLVLKQTLVEQKLQLRIRNDLAVASMGSINRELARINKKYDALVPAEGVIEAYQNGISRATTEYLEVLVKYNQTALESKISVQLRISEPGELGGIQPTKKMLLVIISGVISLVFCVLVLFIIFFFDSSLWTPNELANSTGIPVLGHICLLNSKVIDLREIWNNAATEGEARHFRNLMQSLRFETDIELGDSKVLLINSITKSTGKTFVAINLAYAYSFINKRVLVIDGNIHNNGITQFTNTKYYIEDFLDGNFENHFFDSQSKIKVLGNKGGDVSILEISSEKNITEKFKKLRAEFDIIIIESPSLGNLNKSKEWTLFADKVVTVYESGKSISEKYKPNLAYLKSLDGKFIGWILNLVKCNDYEHLHED
jgi:succinoglycan biosynthesis transport protein ExoP